MAILSDDIERFIKHLIDEYQGELELKRNELAEHFSCAPSQINYVLSTRFTPEHGYLTESRRGGGGYIRVVRVSVDRESYLAKLIANLAGEISAREVRSLISRLLELDLATKEQARMILAATSDKALNAAAANRDHVRANICKHMLIELFANRQQ